MCVVSRSPDSDVYVQKNVATLIREIAKHTPEVLFMCMFVRGGGEEG